MRSLEDWYPDGCGTYDLSDGREIRAEEIVAAESRAAFAEEVRKIGSVDTRAQQGLETDKAQLLEELLAGSFVAGKCHLFLQGKTARAIANVHRLHALPFARIRDMKWATPSIGDIVKSAPSPCEDPLMSMVKGPKPDAGKG